MEKVNLIASGYEWTCPHCQELNKAYEARANYYCTGCGKQVEAGLPEHATSY